MIDYPKAKDYVESLYARLRSLSLLSEEQVLKYRKHIENLAKIDDDLAYN